MWAIAAAFAEVVLRRRGPESLPDSSFLVLFLLTAYLLVSLVDLGLYAGLTSLNLTKLVASTLLFFAFVFAVLAFFKLDRRYRQTVSAMLGVEILITLAYWPIAVIALVFGASLEAESLLWLRLGFALWASFVGAWILARALSQPLIVGLMFEILFVLATFGMLEFLDSAFN